MRFVVVDDDTDIVNLLKLKLELRGHQVRGFNSSLEALKAVSDDPPDCLLVDIIMPEMDGIELCRKVRLETRLKAVKIIVVSGKVYQADRKRAIDAGADGFVVKSGAHEEMMEAALALLADTLSLTFWGCRGTMPVPGPKTVKFGGNTSCVSLTFPDGHLFVFDAGTGIKPLGNALMSGMCQGILDTIWG